MFKDDKYDKKRRPYSYVIEIFEGKVTGVYRVNRPRNLLEDFMVVILDDNTGRDIHAAPVEVRPLWAANPKTKQVIDKLQNILPEKI